MFWKHAERIFAKVLGNCLQKYWKVCSVKILILRLLKHCELFCKTTERYYAEILRGILQKYWMLLYEISEGSSNHKIIDFLVKSQVLGLFPVTPWLKFLVLIQTRKRWHKKKVRIKDGLGDVTILSDVPLFDNTVFFGGKSCLWFKGQIHINLSLVEIMFFLVLNSLKLLKLLQL